MTLTSEVENILNGQVVRKESSDKDKAIGVSTANLLPDANNEVPLSKQSAFALATPAAEQAVTETITETPAVTPAVTETVAETPAVAPATEVVTETAKEEVATETPATETIENPLDDPQVSALNALQESTAADAELENLVDDKPVGDVLTASPVDVAAPDSLESFSFGAKKEEAPVETVSETKEEEKKEEKVELPPMPDKILAEEPNGVNDSLFANTETAEQTAEVAAAQAPAAETEVASESEGPETTVVSEGVVDSPFTVPAIENPLENAAEELAGTATETKEEAETASVSETITAEETTETLAPPVVETAENVVPAIDTAVDENIETLGTETAEETAVELETPKAETKAEGAPSAPVSLFEEQLEAEEEAEKNAIEEKLDLILAELAEIKEEIKRLSEEKRSEEKKTTEEVVEALPTLEDSSLNDQPVSQSIPSVEQTVVDTPKEEPPKETVEDSLGLPTLQESLDVGAPTTQTLAPATPEVEAAMDINDEQIVGGKGYFI